MLTRPQLDRYSRQIVLPEIGGEGQQRLAAASVLVVGAGGLGSPALLYLAGAGIGRLGIVDSDAVDVSNLHRQVLHGSSDVGRAKTASAMARLQDLNPDTVIEGLNVRLTADNAMAVLEDYDVVIDGSDNFPTRYLVSDACVLLGKPLVYGALSRFEGHVSVLAGGTAPCYRCLYPTPPPPAAVPSCAEAGVLGTLPGVIGTLMATEALRIVLGGFGPDTVETETVGPDTVGPASDAADERGLAGRLLVIDLLEPSFTAFTVTRSPDCVACGPHRTVRTLIDYERFCGLP